MENVSLGLSEQVNSCSFADLLTRSKATNLPPQEHSLKRWDENEINELKRVFYRGDSIDNICEHLDRPLHGVNAKIRALGLKRRRSLSYQQEQYLKANYWLLGAAECGKHLKRSRETVAYYAKKLGLLHKSKQDCNPPIPRKLLPYDMVQRVSVLERECPTSTNRIQDSVVIFYDKTGPSTPMMAMHLADLLTALEIHFNRRSGVVTGALLQGYKR
ncbi:gcrA cell cycle regulator family protein [Vibrio anguillarum]|nr:MULTISPECIES: gcrA cell cycle regulator family protein [Vibrio]MBF4343081.1 gcrA cell cycle regulator family protein [Vibrio anguillarum]MDE1335389.1 gcrA cell cycle regulator family protein [Vibrio aestuarianus]